nr:P1 family peptidase [Bauldia sp.]
MNRDLRNLITDVPGIAVGNAADDRVKTGVTVVVCEAPSAAAVHVMGGAPGTRETDLLAPEQTYGEIDAVVLSGGSAFGLDAAGSVTADLAAAGRGLAVGP